MLSTDSIQNTELKLTLDKLAPLVSKNVSLVTPEDLGQEELYHIAHIKFSELTPNISKRSAPSEDNTLPRVHCSNSLLGCIAGYSALETNTFKFYDPEEKGDFNGEFNIYSIPFEYALKPNKKLVYDAQCSGELWMFSFSKETATFKPSCVNKMFVSSMEVLPGGIGNHDVITSVLVSIRKDTKVRLAGEDWLEAGYWLVKVGRRIGECHRLISYEPVDKEVYNTDRQSRVALLSFREPPSFTAW